MPRIHDRNFRVRYYECDLHGELSTASYLRYMQEAAFDASAAAGYDLQRYETMHRLWLIRETDIEYLRTVRYGDTVQVRTWVADFRRIRSNRAYEFRLEGSGEIVARAQTDWVFVDWTTGRPAPIPIEMMAAFFPEGAPASAPPRPRYPALPAPPAGALSLRRQVEWADLDAARHVNNAVYLTYLEDCHARAAEELGWSHARTRTEGFAVVARRHRIEYRQPAVLGDELELTTWVSELHDNLVERHFLFLRVGDGSPVVQACTWWGCADPSSGQPRPFPPAFLAGLVPNMAGT